MNYKFLSKTLLFRGNTEEEIKAMLSCLGAEQKHYIKGSTVYHAGEPVDAIGLVLSGRVQIENDDHWGNKSLLDSVGEGMIFAETYACIPGEPMQVSVTASENSEILFLNAARVLQTCPGACEYHGRLIRNLLTISAQKNLILSRRIFLPNQSAEGFCPTFPSRRPPREAVNSRFPSTASSWQII